jgi:hypothetical protein
MVDTQNVVEIWITIFVRYSLILDCGKAMKDPRKLQVGSLLGTIASRMGHGKIGGIVFSPDLSWNDVVNIDSIPMQGAIDRFFADEAVAAL